MIPLPARRAVASRLTAAIAVLACLLIPSVAHGDSGTEADAAGAAFSGGQRVYVSPEAGQSVDVQAVSDAIGDEPIYVAVVPPNTPPADVLTQLESSLQMKATYVVVSGTQQQAQSNVICSDRAQPLVDEAATEQQETRAAGDLTGFLTTYVEKVDDAPLPGDSDCSDEVSGSGGFWSALPWILGAVLLGAGGGYLWLRNRQRSKAGRDAVQRQRVTQALDALARDIDEVGSEGGGDVQLALQDARERHILAADILADADASSDFSAAMRATHEGQHAAYYARKKTGFAGAPPKEVEAPRVAKVESERNLVIGDDVVVVYPTYQPGAPHYFAGSSEHPAGWYSMPIGNDHLLGSIADDE